MAEYFSPRNRELHAEDVPLSKIAADFGTPLFVYSKAALVAGYRELDAALNGTPHLICYALKANSNLAILNLFARLGAGFDIVSGGELSRVLAAGGDPAKVVFSGVGKSSAELRQALAARVLCFNVESESELLRLDRIAGEMGRKAPVSFRVNPDVDAKTHAYIATGLRDNKFGIPFDVALALYRKAREMRNVQLTGIDCHIGSQITEVTPLLEAFEKMLGLADQLANEGIRLAHIDAGGGLGIRYGTEMPPTIEQYAGALVKAMRGRGEKLVVEPGRLLVGNAGVLLTRVEYLKPTPSKNFAIVDAAMNDLIRPALYGAFQEIRVVVDEPLQPALYDVVGPVCESADFLGKDRVLALRENSLLAIMSCGAYGSVMSSNYNSRGRAAEVLVDGAKTHLISRREAPSELFDREQIIESLKL
ncbi:MAG: diaminopimelate decarboxylase [Burkholderiales bacterium]|nr:diaminopimelate decarboxylase [Burkholderiales bacterium]